VRLRQGCVSWAGLRCALTRFLLTRSVAGLGHCHNNRTRVSLLHRYVCTCSRFRYRREMTDEERQQLEIWWARLSPEQRVECRSLDPSKPVPRGHVLWSQPLLDLSGGLVPHPPDDYVDPCVSAFLNEKRQVADA
jgi:hypothetical protein